MWQGLFLADLDSRFVRGVADDRVARNLTYEQQSTRGLSVGQQDHVVIADACAYLKLFSQVRLHPVQVPA